MSKEIMADFTTTSLKICVVTQQLANIYSGPGLHATNLVRRLVKDKHQVTVLVPENQAIQQNSTYRTIMTPNPFIAQNQARWLSLSHNFGKALNDIQKNNDFDLIHFTDFRESLFCSLNFQAIGNVNDTYTTDISKLYYYTTHYSDGLVRWLYYHFARMLERFALSKYQALIMNSNFTNLVFSAHYPALADRFKVIYKSIEPSIFNQAWKVNREKKVHPVRILCIGGNMQRKGVPDLLRAAPAVIRAYPESEFWIVGQDKSIPRLKQLSSQLGVATNVKFLGHKSQKEILDLYSQATLFVMPSLTEAFGMVFLEAMCAGVPVIGTSVGGIPEIINDGENGLLVTPEKISDLSDAILHLVNNLALLEKFRMAGRETALRFNVDSMMEKTYQVYNKLVKFPLSA